MSKLPTFLKKARKLTIKLLGINNEKDENQYKKNIIIGQTKKETKDRRSNMECRVFEFKIVKNKMKKFQENKFKSILLQKKWLRNYALTELNTLSAAEERVSEERINKSTGEKYEVLVMKNKEGYYVKMDELLKSFSNIKEVTVKVGDKFETRSIIDLPSPVKDDVITELQQNFRSLAGAKKAGLKTGTCKYVSVVNEFNLKQFGKTHSILSDKEVSVTKVGKLRVRGIDQLERFGLVKDLIDNNKGIEFANAKIIRRPSGYYFNQTVFISPEAIPKKVSLYNQDAVGIDFGIRTQMTYSDGLSININIPESEQLKKRQSKVNKKVTNLFKLHNIEKLSRKHKSKNFRKLKFQVEKAYEKVTNQRKTVKRKVVSFTKQSYGTIVVQDEAIHEWHKSENEGFGKVVQNGSMGGIISKLKKLLTTIVLSQRFTSTRTCQKCGNIKSKDEMGLSVTVYVCGKDGCDLIAPRDRHSSVVIEEEGTGAKIPLEQRYPIFLKIDAADILKGVSLQKQVVLGRNYAL